MIIKPKALVALTLLAAVGAAQPAVAQTIGSGSGNGSTFPFGTYDPSVGASPAYQGEYQQIYRGSAFGASPVTITQIAFQSFNDGFTASETANYNFTITLGNSATTVTAPSATFSANKGAGFPATPNFNGPLNATLLNMSNSGTFDLVITLTNPFTYNPASGDLLVDIVNNSPFGSTTGEEASFVFGASPNVARVFFPQRGPGGTTAAEAGQGLLTRFTTNPAAVVPEPSQTVVLGLGMLGLAGLTLRARKSRKSAA